MSSGFRLGKHKLGAPAHPDVEITEPTENDILTYEAGKWKNKDSIVVYSLVADYLHALDLLMLGYSPAPPILMESPDYTFTLQTYRSGLPAPPAHLERFRIGSGITPDAELINIARLILQGDLIPYTPDTFKVGGQNRWLEIHVRDIKEAQSCNLRAHALAHAVHGDVNISAPTEGQMLIYDGATGKWINADPNVNVIPKGTPYIINLTATGIIRTPATGKKIRILGFAWSSNADVITALRFGTGGDLLFAIQAKGVIGMNLIGCMVEGAVNEALYGYLSAAGTMRGTVIIEEI